MHVCMYVCVCVCVSVCVQTYSPDTVYQTISVAIGRQAITLCHIADFVVPPPPPGASPRLRGH